MNANTKKMWEKVSTSEDTMKEFMGLANETAFRYKSASVKALASYIESLGLGDEKDIDWQKIADMLITTVLNKPADYYLCLH